MTRIYHSLVLVILTFGSTIATADDQTLDAAIGGGLGGALGAAVGAELGGRDGAIAGAGIGAAAGAAIATDGDDHHDRPSHHHRDYDRDDHHAHPQHPHSNGFCPPGQAKKGRC